MIQRARLRLGEDRYHPLKNNCEHFCEWCVRGEPRSYQVDVLIAIFEKYWVSGAQERNVTPPGLSK